MKRVLDQEPDQGPNREPEKKVCLSDLIPPNSVRHTSKWISASSLYSVILEDHFSEWLKLYGPSEEKKGILPFLFSQGHAFEAGVVQLLRQKYQVVTISPDGRYSLELLPKTQEAIENQVEIIHSAPLSNPNNRTYGVADLLIRTDILTQLFPDLELNSGEGLYRVIDIKFTTLPLRADGVHLLNSDSIKAYKAQLYIYTAALARLLGVFPTQAFLLGRKYSYTSRKETFVGESCFDRLGVVNFSGIDSEVISNTEMALEWIRQLREEGAGWSFQDHPELYPNLKQNPTPLKQKIARDISEITEVWYCGVHQRELALAQGISSWRDPRFNSVVADLRGNRGIVLDQLLEVNRNGPAILPSKISRMKAFLCKGKVSEFFVDFETVGGMFDDFTRLPKPHSIAMIFMITVGWVEEEGYRSETYTAQQLTSAEERRIMTQFVSRIGKDSELFHWSDAEPNEWKAALRRQQIQSPDFNLQDRWTDLLYIFHEEPITVRGALNFSLKSIARAMAEEKMISSCWDESLSDGLNAMYQAYQAYLLPPAEKEKALAEIEKYNQIDTRILSEILNYLRQHLL